MPERKTLQRARRAKRQGKRASTQAGEFVREEMHHVKSGKHGAKSRKQAVAIGLSKGRGGGGEGEGEGRGRQAPPLGWEPFPPAAHVGQALPRQPPRAGEA